MYANELNVPMTRQILAWHKEPLEIQRMLNGMRDEQHSDPGQHAALIT